MSTISASTTTTTAYKVTADTTGTLVFQTGSTPTTAMTLGSDQSVTFAGAQTYTGAATFSSSIAVQGITVGRGAGSVSTNTAVGSSALASNSTGLNIVAVGYQAYQNGTASYNHAFGYGAMSTGVVTGTQNTAIARFALNNLTSGVNNVALGDNALESNTTGSYNFAGGMQALKSNTTAGGNTAIGYQAAYTNSTGASNVYLGQQAGYSATSSSNVFVGSGAGYYVTSGAKNTIIGRYDGNQGGLDIRTSSNYIVLSDGDGNPAAVFGAYQSAAGTYSALAGVWTFGLGGSSAGANGQIQLNGTSASDYGPTIFASANGSQVWQVGSYSKIVGGANQYLTCRNTSGGVYLNGGSATSWTAVSDERVKENLVDITDAANKVSTLRAVTGNYTWDEEKTRRPFLIAQDVLAVLPEAVAQSNPDELGISYSEVIPLLVAAIKELKAEIDTLKGQA